jgi:hypothetical protein
MIQLFAIVAFRSTFVLVYKGAVQCLGLGFYQVCGVRVANYETAARERCQIKWLLMSYSTYSYQIVDRRRAGMARWTSTYSIGHAFKTRSADTPREAAIKEVGVVCR